MWQQIIFETTKQEVEVISDYLTDQGALAITLQDGQDEAILEPAPGDAPLWNCVEVTALFSGDEFLNPILEELGLNPQLNKIRLERVADKEWHKAWMDRFVPLQFGKRLWIYPSNIEAPDPSVVYVKLDPGLAFGTGTHPTTALCLQWLDEHLKRGVTVVDYGCGSGILAMSALKLGAAFAYAVDYDPQALTSTHNNAVNNEIELADLWLGKPEAFQLKKPVELLIANILADPIMELLPVFSAAVKTGGALVLSGILNVQAEEVISIYQADFEEFSVATQDEWVCISAKRR